jgi:pimeloyl-ACP methyl ester carboxylesterase
VIGETGLEQDGFLEPIFVRHRTSYLAAALVVPPECTKLVVLLQGFGTSRSHRNRLWTMTAADLAQRGIATVRFDYPGMGDSTGSRNYGFDDPPLDAARRVIDVAREAVGLEHFAIAGNCLGARMALAIGASDPSCRGVGVLLPGTLEGIVRAEDEWPAQLGTLLDKRVGLARKVIGLATRRAERRLRLAPDVVTVLGSKPVLVLYVGPDDVWRHVQSAFRSVAPRSQGGRSAPMVGVHVAMEGRAGLQSLSSQEAVRRILVDWLAEDPLREGARDVVVFAGRFPERRAG